MLRTLQYRSLNRRKFISLGSSETLSSYKSTPCSLSYQMSCQSAGFPWAFNMNWTKLQMCNMPFVWCDLHRSLSLNKLWGYPLFVFLSFTLMDLHFQADPTQLAFEILLQRTRCKKQDALLRLLSAR